MKIMCSLKCFDIFMNTFLEKVKQFQKYFELGEYFAFLKITTNSKYLHI